MAQLIACLPLARVIPKTIIKMVQTASLHGTHALGLEFGSAAQLSKRPGSVWNCLWGNALKRSPGIIRKSRVSYPGPGFLSSATWSSLPKKHYNGLNQTKPRSVHVLYTGIYVCTFNYFMEIHQGPPSFEYSQEFCHTI